MNALDLRYNKRYLGTYILTGLTFFVWLIQVGKFGVSAGSSINMWDAGAFFGEFVKRDPSQLWRLISANFLHFSWIHVLMNLFTLFFIGRLIEVIFGTLRFVLVYLVSGIFAYTAVFLFNPTSLTAGASASIFGLFGAIAMLGFFTGSPELKEIGKSFVVLIIINIALNLFQTGVSVVGHIGGAVGGGLLAAIVPPKSYTDWIPPKMKVAATALFTVLLVLFLLIPFFLK